MFTLSEFAIEFERATRAEMIVRCERAIEHLLGAVQEVYLKELSGSHGGAGGVGALQKQLQVAEDLITALLGFGKSGDHLKYVEYGVRPADPDGYSAYTTIPPVKAFFEWIKLARLTLTTATRTRARSRRPSVKKSRVKKRNRKPSSLSADDKARLHAAWAMAIYRRRYGYKGLHIIERVVKAETANLQALLNGQ